MLRLEKTWGAKRERCQLELFDTKGEGIHSEQQEPFPSTKKDLRKEERVVVGTELSLLQGGGEEIPVPKDSPAVWCRDVPRRSLVTNSSCLLLFPSLCHANTSVPC